MPRVINLFRLPFQGTAKDASEEALIRAARGGDRQAFDTLVASYHLELRRFLARRVPEGDLEDVMQETWVAAWTALPTFDRRSRFKTWLYALSLNKCRDHHRLQRRSEQPKQDIVLDVPAAVDVQKQTENRQLTHSLLESLTASQREVLELYYFSELTLPEISRALGRNLNTVKYQFYRAHVQASEFLRGQGEFVPSNEEKATCV